ncbi:hypothetical protein GCM10010170_031940 [Dactylosporangium salmoneum]|uniref:Uncharacterized protein n=1 Tax=Dactylosporangium salmoneum TaxID=53361 RepID=A0ABP5T5N5_9ACTN
MRQVPFGSPGMCMRPSGPVCSGISISVPYAAGCRDSSFGWYGSPPDDPGSCGWCTPPGSCVPGMIGSPCASSVIDQTPAMLLS